MPRRREVIAATGLTLAAGCLGESDGSAGGYGAQTTTDEETETTTPETAASPDPDVDSADLLLNWKPNGLHVPYFTAKAMGFYEDRGLPISDIQAGEGSDFSAKQVGLENVAFGVTSSDQVLNINSRDVSTLAVGVMMQQSPVVVFTTEETFGGPLESVDQLEGTTVGTGPGMVKILTKLLLERKGVLDSVEMVNTGYDTVQKLLSGDVDAAGGVFGDAIAAQHQDRTTHSIPVAETVPSYGHVLATAPAYAEEHPDAVRAFLQGTAKGTAYAMNNPEEGVDFLVEANPVLEESREQALDKWKRMAEGFIPSDTVAEKGWGWNTETPWETTHSALADADLLGGTVDPTSVFTNEYLETDYQYIGSFQDLVGDAG